MHTSRHTEIALFLTLFPCSTSYNEKDLVINAAWRLFQCYHSQPIVICISCKIL